jgi:hypothetical protein
MASSFADCENAVKLRDVLAVIETVSQNSERQRLGLCHSFFTRGAVRENAGQIGHFANPTAVFLALDIDCEFAHCC